MRKFLFAAIMQCMAWSLAAQGSVTGRVTDENGAGLQGAAIKLEHRVKPSGKNGEFAFENVTNKTAEVTVSFVGYNTEVFMVNVPFSGDIRLVKSSHQLQEITVSGVRASEKSPVAYNDVTKKNIEKTNLGQDIPYLLSFTPSFVATSDAGTGVGYTGFRIRGTDASRINVTINGIPYNDADEQGTYWVDIPDIASSVENIQVQRGVGTSTNGASAFGANIGLQTGIPNREAGGEVSASYGSFNTSKANVAVGTGLMNDHWALNARLSSVSSDGYIDRGWVKMKSYFVQAEYLAGNTNLKLITFGGKEQTYHAWDGVPKDKLATDRTYNPCGYMGDDTDGNPLYYKNQTDNYLQTNYQLLLNHKISEMFKFNAGLHYTNGDGYYEEYKQDQKLVKYNLNPFSIDNSEVTKSDLVRQKKMGNEFAGSVFSFSFQKNKLESTLGGALNCYWGNHWGDVIWVKNYVGNVLPITEYYRSKVTKWDGNIYLKTNYYFNDRVSINTDLQYRRVTYLLTGTNDEWDDAISGMQLLDVDKKFDFFNPKVGLFFRPVKNNEAFVSFAVANREPTRTNYTDGTKDSWPASERLYDLEAGYKYSGSKISAGANLYYMRYHNQLILTGQINDIGEALTENIPDSYRAGIELQAGIKPLYWLRWEGNVTLSRNRIIGCYEYVDVYSGDNWDWTSQQKNSLGDKPIAFSPDVTANSLISVKIKEGEIGWRSVYVGKQYIDNTGSKERQLKDYFLNNLIINYPVKVPFVKSVNLTLIVNNIFDVKYISNAWTYSYYFQDTDGSKTRYNDFGYYPQAGFNVLAGVTVKF